MKKIISLILTFAILLSMLPGLSFAKTPDLNIGIAAGALQNTNLKGLELSAYTGLVNCLKSADPSFNKIEFKKEEYNTYTIRYMNSRISIEVYDCRYGSYELQLTSNLDGNYSWSYSDGNGLLANGTTNFANINASYVETVDGSYTIPQQTQLNMQLPYLRTQAIILLDEALLYFELPYRFYDYGINESYFNGSCNDAHNTYNYYSKSDGTKTAVCYTCGKRDTISGDNAPFTALKDALLAHSSAGEISESTENVVYSISYTNREIIEIEVSKNYHQFYLEIDSNLDYSYKWSLHGKGLDGSFWARGVTSRSQTDATPTTLSSNLTEQYNYDIAIEASTDLRNEAVYYLKKVLTQLDVGYTFADFGFNSSFFTGGSADPTPPVTPNEPENADAAAFDALAAAITQNGTLTDDGYCVSIPLSDNPQDDYMSAYYVSDNNPKLVIALQESDAYSFVMQICKDSIGQNRCDVAITVTSGNTVMASTVTSATDTKNTLPTMTGFNTSNSTDRTEATQKTAELRSTAVAFLELLLQSFEIDARFSNFGFNELYFCPSGHSFSDYVYNGDATDTADGTKTAVCFECGHKDTVIAEGTAGAGITKTAFDTVANFLLLNKPDDHTVTATVQNDGAEVEYSIGFDKEYDVLTTKITTVYDGKTITFSFEINRALDGNYLCYLTGKYNDSYVTELDVTAKIPADVYGEYTVTYFKGGDGDRAELQEVLSVFTALSTTIFIDFAKLVDEGLTVADFGFEKGFMCGYGHTLLDAVYNNDATYEKNGTQTGSCYFCGDTVTEEVMGTKLVKIVDTSKIFTDVKSGKWYKNAVDYCYSHGFIAGMEDTRFGLDDPVTRGMFITILARIAGVDTAGSANKVTTKFSDVKSGKYYTAAIKWGVENGIVSGMSKTEFAPNDNITREQICVMIVNFAQFCGVYIDEVVTPASFTDSSKIASWAKTAVTVCQKAEIISGYEENGRMYFKPKNIAKRSEAAQILYKFHSEFVNIY